MGLVAAAWGVMVASNQRHRSCRPHSDMPHRRHHRQSSKLDSSVSSILNKAHEQPAIIVSAAPSQQQPVPHGSSLRNA